MSRTCVEPPNQLPMFRRRSSTGSAHFSGTGPLKTLLVFTGSTEKKKRFIPELAVLTQKSVCPGSVCPPVSVPITRGIRGWDVEIIHKADSQLHLNSVQNREFRSLLF